MHQKIIDRRSMVINSMVDYMNVSQKDHPEFDPDFDPGYTQREVDQCEKILDAFIATLIEPVTDYSLVMNAVKNTVIALNKLNDSCESPIIETDQREYICAFIEEVIIAKGVDIEALAASQKCTRHEITDAWREW